MRKILTAISTVALVAALASCGSVVTPADSSDYAPVKKLGGNEPTSFWEHEFELSDGRKITCIESVQSDGYGRGQGLSCDWDGVRTGG